MITAITNNNINIFSHLIPEDLLAELLKRKDFAALGSIRLLKGQAEAVGALLYNIDLTEDDERYARLRWIYVMEENRRENVGSELMMEFFWNAINLSWDFILCDVPSSADNEELFDFLNIFGFDFKPTELPTAEFPIKELIKSDMLKKLKVLSRSADIIPLKNVNDRDFSAFCRSLSDYRRENEEYLDTCIGNAEKSYYDKNISAFFKDRDGNYSCGILVRRDAFDNFRIVALGTLKKVSGNDIAALIGFSFEEMKKSCAPDSVVSMDFHTEKQISMAGSLMDEAAFPVVLRGFLYCELDNMSMDEWEGYKEKSIREVEALAKEKSGEQEESGN